MLTKTITKAHSANNTQALVFDIFHFAAVTGTSPGSAM
jgi:hypothetical protein